MHEGYFFQKFTFTVNALTEDKSRLSNQTGSFGYSKNIWMYLCGNLRSFPGWIVLIVSITLMRSIDWMFHWWFQIFDICEFSGGPLISHSKLSREWSFSRNIRVSKRFTISPFIGPTLRALTNLNPSQIETALTTLSISL